MIYALMPAIFIAAILCIAFEDKIKINKAAVAISSAILLWSMLFMSADGILGNGYSEAFADFSSKVPSIAEMSPHDRYFSFLSQYAIIEHLGDVATTLFFVIGSMIIVEIVDSHGGFRVITDRIHTRSKRRLLVIISLLTFVLSALLDNLATAIVMIAILRKFIPEQKEMWIFCSMVVIAANAGGSWSPIGDVTTILLWSGGNLTPGHQISHLLLPALICMAVPLTIAYFTFFKRNERWNQHRQVHAENDMLPQIKKRSRIVILVIGILSLAFVPVFNELTGLPPFMGVMCGLAILWIYTDLMYSRIDTIDDKDKLSIANVFHKIDMSTIMFFFGILMSVAALETAGQLSQASGWLDEHLHSPLLIAFILGMVSSFLDNVALVAGTMGMYDIVTDPAAGAYALQFAADGSFWTFLAYCCVTGGSILIIGSATGVAVMGMEKISFGYYLKRFSALALAGYICGAAVYLLL